MPIFISSEPKDGNPQPRLGSVGPPLGAWAGKFLYEIISSHLRTGWFGSHFTAGGGQYAGWYTNSDSLAKRSWQKVLAAGGCWLARVPDLRKTGRRAAAVLWGGVHEPRLERMALT